REIYKIYADLMSANLYRIEKGLEEVELENFYDENLEKIKIPLDKKLTPAENAQRYYKKYSKLKNAYNLLLNQIPETEKEIEYLENVLNSLDNCTEIIEIEEIKEELIKEGYIKGKIAPNKASMKSKPYHFISSDGFHIYVGKNNKQNDMLTLKTAKKNDLWFHVQNMPGSHVIVRAENKQVPERTLLEAALLAAYYSKGKNSNNVPVDYTERKNVKKPKDAKAGMVIYENYKTIFVTPDKEKIDNIKRIEE
ncbi:MAG: NFACT family protein, partial [Tissierellales bacterium]